MVRAIHKLTAREAETISEPGRHSDGGSLSSSRYRVMVGDVGCSSIRCEESSGRPAWGRPPRAAMSLKAAQERRPPEDAPCSRMAATR